jgi:hypothetical protein
MARKRRKRPGTRAPGSAAVAARREATAAARARREPAPAPAAPAAPASRPRRGGRPSLDERPKPPWHPVPLVELCVLVGIVLLVLGALNLSTDRGKLLLLCGMVLGSLGGADTALREHFNGYRSHTTLIAGFPAVLAASGAYFLGLPWPVVIGAAVLGFAGVFWWARRAFMWRAARR